MARENIIICRRKLLRFLVSLRDVGIETKFHIYDILLDPLRTRKRKSQVMVAAIVSKEEILSEDFSVLQTFTDYLHTVSYRSEIASRVVHHGRVAVVMNAGEKYFFEHGECRLFDPDRKYLFNIIDEEVLYRTRKKSKLKKSKTGDRGGHGVFENMENTYMKIFHTLDNAIVLLYSFYIPCSIDFHNCAKLLHDFVNDSGHEMVIGYEHVHDLTDENVSLKWLTHQNIVVLSDTEMENEIQKQTLSDMGSSAEDNVFDNLADISDDVEDFKAIGHQRLYRRDLCRKFVKVYNNFIC